MFTRLLIILTLSCPIVFAADPPSPGSGAAGTAPSDASIKQLLEITQTHKMLDSTMAQMNALMTQMMQQQTEILAKMANPSVIVDVEPPLPEADEPTAEEIEQSAKAFAAAEAASAKAAQSNLARSSRRL